MASCGFSKYAEIKPFFDYIGKHQIEGEEFENYKKLEAEIEKTDIMNKKLAAARKPLNPMPM